MFQSHISESSAIDLYFMRILLLPMAEKHAEILNGSSTLGLDNLEDRGEHALGDGPKHTPFPPRMGK